MISQLQGPHRNIRLGTIAAALTVLTCAHATLITIFDWRAALLIVHVGITLYVAMIAHNRRYATKPDLHASVDYAVDRAAHEILVGAAASNVELLERRVNGS